MKYRIVCISFLLIFVLYFMFFNRVNFSEIEKLFSSRIMSIDVVLADNGNEIEGIKNGNYVIKKIDDLCEIFNYEYVGLSIRLFNYKIDLLEIFDKYNIVIDNTYIINGNKVYDGCFVNKSGNNPKTIQIVEAKEEIMIGVPSLINGF